MLLNKHVHIEFNSHCRRFSIHGSDTPQLLKAAIGDILLGVAQSYLFIKEE